MCIGYELKTFRKVSPESAMEATHRSSKMFIISEEVSFYPTLSMENMGQKVFASKFHFISISQSINSCIRFLFIFFYLFGYSMPSHFALQYISFLFTISRISLKVNMDVTSPLSIIADAGFLQWIEQTLRCSPSPSAS